MQLSLKYLFFAPLLLENLIYHCVVGGKPQLTLFFFLGQDLKSFLFPLVLAWAIFSAFAKINWREVQLSFLLGNFIAFISFILVTQFRSRLGNDEAVYLLRCVLAGATVGSSFFIFSSPKKMLQFLCYGISRNALGASLALTVVFASTLFARQLWPLVLTPIRYAVVGSIQLLQIPVSSSILPGSFFLSHPQFGVSIFAPCSGFEGLRYLSLALLVPLVFDADRLHLKWIRCILASLLYVFFLNVIRITSIYAVGAVTAKGQGGAVALEKVMDAFHSGAGAVIYTLGITVLLLFLYRRPAAPTSVHT